MHIEYLHRQGGYTHQGPSGTLYDFAPGVDGRRIAEVTDPTDQARFLSIADLRGKPLFVPVTEGQTDLLADANTMIEEPAKPKPKAKKARYAPDPADVSASLD